ncbi:MAG: phosphoglycolate phosphatase [Deltaproteobacteria bacterium]|nr:phosphoglycolate phosphatase [Deltaproteobacteria bacterium]
MTVNTALFDLDGTLVDSLDDLTEAVNHMLAAFGKAPLPPASVRRLVGKGTANLVQRALGTEAHADIAQGLGLFLEFNTAHIADRSRLFPGVPETLEALAGSGIRMAIISNKQEALSRLILETLGIGRFFEAVCGGDTFPEMKPSPLPLLRVMENLGVNQKQAVMVGDSINDIQAGRAAGITTIGCAWGYGGPEELLGAGRVANTCADVAEILLGCGCLSEKIF